MTRAKRLYLIDDTQKRVEECLHRLAEISENVNAYIQGKAAKLDKFGAMEKYGLFMNEKCTLDTVIHILTDAHEDLQRTQNLVNHYKYCSDSEIENTFTLFEIAGILDTEKYAEFVDDVSLE